jgi:hypothetical protein
MELKRAGSQPSQRGSADSFTGTVRIDPLSGGVRLTTLHADDVQVRVAGSGDAAFFADETLDVRIAGSGDVTCSGNATVRGSVTGSGSVTRK